MASFASFGKNEGENFFARMIARVQFSCFCNEKSKNQAQMLTKCPMGET
jgi:hypothetical protein